jgi:hypothetical protein
MYISGDSLSEDVSVSPGWRTSTAKTKAVMGLVLSLSFGHSLGFVHGRPTGNTDILNENGVIEIADF